MSWHLNSRAGDPNSRVMHDGVRDQHCTVSTAAMINCDSFHPLRKAWQVQSTSTLWHAV